MLNDKTLKKKLALKMGKKNPEKLMQRSQSCNPLNLRPRLNKEDQFQTNLILISQSQFNKEQQLKKPKKTIVIFKISGKS